MYTTTVKTLSSSNTTRIPSIAFYNHIHSSLLLLFLVVVIVVICWSPS